MSFPLHLSPFTRKQLYRHLQQAYASGALKLVKRIHALLALAEQLHNGAFATPYAGYLLYFAVSLFATSALCFLTRFKTACRACLRLTATFSGVDTLCDLRNRP